jgi:hypothetical protein
MCDAPGCQSPATRGDEWADEALLPIEAHRKGIQLRLTVKDLAVGLRVCDEHARVLTEAAWTPVLATLEEWGWRSLRWQHPE